MKRKGIAMELIEKEIARLKEERRAVILAHYYVPDDVQRVADYVGDSFYLSKKAKETDAQTIVFAGVRFMGESAKILNPQKRVLMPDSTADCPMAHMVTAKAVEDMRRRVEKDIWYIEHWSFWLDIQIMFKTIADAIHGDEKAY